MPVREAEAEVAKRLADAILELREAGNAAHEFGLRISDKAIAAINAIPDLESRVEVAKWLVRPENFDTVTHPFMSKTDDEQAAEIPKFAAREDVKGSLRDGDTEEYIDARREARREGRRR